MMPMADQSVILASMAPLFVVILFAAVIIMVVVAASRYQKYQQERRNQWMLQNGFEPITFDQTGGCLGFTSSRCSYLEHILFSELASISTFNTGDSRRVGFAAKKSLPDRQIAFVEYQYSTGSGKNRSTHYFDIVLVNWAYCLPEFEIRPQDFGDNIAGFFGLKDVQFESDEFNRKFYVRFPSREIAFDFIHPQLMEEMLRSWTLKWQGQMYWVVFIFSRGQGIAMMPRIEHELRVFEEMMQPFVKEKVHNPKWQPAYLPTLSTRIMTGDFSRPPDPNENDPFKNLLQ